MFVRSLVVSAMLLLSCKAAGAQVLPCLAPPPATLSVTTSVSPGDSETPATINVLWAAVAPPVEQAASATSYVVEFGASPGSSEIAIIDTATTEGSYSHPAGNGTYYVRIRSKNACGLSRPSPELRVVVAGGMPFGAPAVRPISTTTVVTSDELGNVMVTGEVRSALGSRPAGFVKVTATFTGLGGATIGTGFSYVQGRTRRGRVSRVIDDSTVGGAESACYVVRTDVPISQVFGVSGAATWSASELEPLRGEPTILSLNQVSEGRDTLRITGQLRNTGPNTTYFNRVTLDIRDARNRVIDCNDAFVDGATIRMSGGVVTDTALASDQSGSFVGKTTASYSAMKRLVTWTSWHEADVALTTPGTYTSWQSLLQDLGHLLHGDPAERARERNAAIDRLSQMVGASAASNKR